MENFVKTLIDKDQAEAIPQFLSCTSFDSGVEYILHTSEPRLMFEVMEMGAEDDPAARLIEHENGDSDYVKLVECYSPAYFEGLSKEQVEQEIEHVMDQLEGWYISEILDLDSYAE